MPDNQPSRRRFFQGVASSAALLGGDANSAGPAQAGQTGPDFTRQSAALEADTVVDSACQFCNSLCRLKVHLKNGRIVEVRGEPDDPVQAGGLCVKGETLMTQLVYNRYRLTRPERRVAGGKGLRRFEVR